MLILQHATLIDFEHVFEYYSSFDKSRRYKELTSYSLLEAKNKANYLECITYFEKYLYYLIDTGNPGYIIGHTVINIKNKTGEIAYAIRPAERRKGFGTILLHLAGEEASTFDIDDLLVSCFETNVGSKKIIENNNATLSREFIDRDTGNKALEYSLTLKKKH